MKAILRYSACTVVAAALLAQPAGAWHRQQDWGRWAGISLGTISGISRGTMSGINPGTMCGIRPGIIFFSGRSRSTMCGIRGGPSAVLGINPGAPRVVSTPAECLVPEPGWCQPQRRFGTCPGAMSP